MSWGAADDYGLLGVRWFDFSELAAKKAKGGRYDAGENVERVSYSGLDCESTGGEVMSAKGGRSLYLNIKEDFLDTDDGGIKLSFDYLDNAIQPISVVYTSGVKSDNDRWRVFDAQREIKRDGSNQWKHAEIIIESGNFENIGTYSSDIKINAACSRVYIKNIKAELLTK